MKADHLDQSKRKLDWKMNSSVPPSAESHPVSMYTMLDLSLVHEQYSIMCHQEKLPIYRASDYLAVAQSIDFCDNKGFISSPIECIDLECRERMVEWSFQVADFANLRRETVCSAIGLLDRFLSTDCPQSIDSLRSRKLFQLASVATLFIAIKINEKVNITAEVFAELSRGNYSSTDIHRTEEEILEALEWRVNGPTVHEFLRQILMLLPNISKKLSANHSGFVDVCNYQLDLSIGDYFFITKKPSIIAFAAILNAAQNYISDPSRHESDLPDIVGELSAAANVDPSSDDILESMARLRILLKNNGHAIQDDHHQPLNHRASVKERDSSPTCVSRFAQAQSHNGTNDTVDLSDGSNGIDMDLDTFEASFMGS